MAIKSLSTICYKAQKKWDLIDSLVIHRYGDLMINEKIFEVQFIYFKFNLNENNTHLTLYSKKLRNYDTEIQGGFWEEVLIKDPEIIFKDFSNNKIISKKLINGTLGENLKTPWFIKMNTLEKSIYNVTFVGTIMRKEYSWQDDGRGKGHKGWVLKNILKEKIDIVLDPEFKIK